MTVITIMKTIGKVLLWVVLIALACLAVAFGASRYLVSKLDGRGTPAPTATNLLRYSSEDGLFFEYPDTFTLSSRTLHVAGHDWDELVLVPAGSTVPQNGEAPPVIAISVFQVPVGQSLESWVRTDARSNYQLSGNALASTTVGGEPALRYTHSGLYEADAVAVKHGTRIFLFEAEWADARSPLRQDFQNLLSTVEFQL